MTKIPFDDIDDIDIPDDELEEDTLSTTDEEDDRERYHFVADKGQGPMRIDRYLAMHLVNVSRNRIQQAAEVGSVLVNGEAVKSNYKIRPCDEITMVMNRPARNLDIVPEDIPLNVVYEDDDILVINKAPGMVVHPGFGNFTGTMVHAIAWRLKDSPNFDPKDSRLGVVHRIDKDTSGLIIAAKTPYAKADLAAQFFNKTTKRKYYAVVWGELENKEGTITGYIGRNSKNRMQMTVLDDPDMGKWAVTHYRLIERIGYVSLVECELETGRTHQIRVHMKHIGHTLFNDERYGGDEILRGTHFSKYKQFVQNCFKTCPRQALHAQTLGFVHPSTKEEMLFQSELPEDMSSLIDKWRRYIENRTI